MARAEPEEDIIWREYEVKTGQAVKAGDILVRFATEQLEKELEYPLREGVLQSPIEKEYDKEQEKDWRLKI